MANKKIHLRIITPQRELYNKDVDTVIMRTEQGDIGVLSGHTPLTCSLGLGAMRIMDGEQELTAAVFSGFAEIMPDSVTVLSDEAEWPDEIDKERAERAKERAERRLKAHERESDLQRAELALKKALVRLEVSAYKPK